MKLKLIKKQAEVGDVITFQFEPEQSMTWQPGQFLQYTLPHADADDRGDKRWFTIAAAPSEGHVQISTRFFEKPSSFKRQLHDLKVGGSIEAGQPEGDFVVTDSTKSYIFIAGGIGITPFRSILKQADHDGSKLTVDLLYGNRDQASSLFLDELKSFAATNPNLKITNILEPDRITAETIKAVANYRSKTIYVSGPEPMVEAFETTLKDLGIPADQQQYDYFPGYKWPATASAN